MDNKALLYSIWISVQCYVAAWMWGEFGGKWIHVYGWLSPFTVHLKLSQYCLLIGYNPIQNKKFGKKENMKKVIGESSTGEIYAGPELRITSSALQTRPVLSYLWLSMDKIYLSVRLHSTSKYIAQALTINAKWMLKPHEYSLIYDKKIFTVI